LVGESRLMADASELMWCCTSLSELTKKRPSACGCSNVIVCGALWLVAAGSILAQSTEWVSEYEPSPRLLARLPSEPYAAAFSADAQRFATGHNDGAVVVWRASDGKPVARLSGHRDTIACLLFNSAGDRLASASYDGSIRVWSIKTGEMLSLLEPQAGRLTCVALSADGRQVAAGGYDGHARLWRDINAATDVVTTTESSGVIRCLSFTPDGQRIAVGDNAGGVSLLNCADLTIIKRNAEHAGAARCLCGAANGDLLVSGGDEGNFIAWGAHTLEHRWSGAADKLQTGHEHPLTGVALSADGRLLASGDSSGEVRVWNVATHELTSKLAGHADAIVALGFQPDAQAVLTIGRDRAVNIWRAKLPATPRLASIEGAPGNLWSIALSPDQTTLYAAGRKGSCGAWDLRTGKQSRQFDGFKGTIDAIALSADGKFLAVCGWRDMNMLVFDTQTGQQSAERTSEAKLRCVRFSPDGQFLLAGRDDGKLQVWSQATGEPVRIANVSEHPIYDFAFAPDGNSIVACGGDWRQSGTGYLKLLDTHEYAILGDLSEHKHAVRSVAFNHDGTRLASTDETGLVIVWDPATRLPLQRFTNATGARPLAWSANGTRLAVGLHDGGVYVWDVNTGELAQRFRGEDDVFSLAFTQDGSVLFSASGKPRVEVWPIIEMSATIEQIRTWVR
jgi:WD40 repeat protein